VQETQPLFDVLRGQSRERGPFIQKGGAAGGFFLDPEDVREGAPGRCDDICFRNIRDLKAAFRCSGNAR